MNDFEALLCQTHEHKTEIVNMKEEIKLLSCSIERIKWAIMSTLVTTITVLVTLILK